MATAITHTSGPWHVESRGEDTVIVPSSDWQNNDDDGCMGRHIATVRSGLNGKQGLGYSGPNARLIAAAPELLATLKALIAAVEPMFVIPLATLTNEHLFQINAEIVRVSVTALDTIAAAEGKS